MKTIHEIAPDIYRICIYESTLRLQFNHFLVKDDQPLLFHTGYKAIFPALREALTNIMDPAKLRWIGFSHFESDECGALNEWLQIAPEAVPITNFLGAILNLNDFAIRSPRVLEPNEIFSTGLRRFRFCSTAHLPHGWDAGVLFEETTQTLFCSDLFFHMGDVEPVTESDVVGRARQALLDFQQSPFAYSVPYTPQTTRILGNLAALQPQVLALMHGSSFQGNGAQALRDLSVVLKETTSS